MNATQRTTLRAFLYALGQQKFPLPMDLQIQLIEISKDISNNTGKLNVLGRQHFTNDYHNAGLMLHCHALLGDPITLDELKAIKELDESALLERAALAFGQPSLY